MIAAARIVLATALLLVSFSAFPRQHAAADDVEQRIADFWKRVDALGPSDVLTATDLGQWALNVTQRDPGAGITIADFRAATAAMQAAFDRAGVGVPPGAPRTPDVEGRIARFWQKLDALGSGDLVTAADLGQWALNVTDRDPNKRIRVDDFRASTAGMQGGLERARSLPRAPAPVSPTPTPTRVGTPSPTPAPSTPTSITTFGSGLRLIGTDVSPGTYRTRTPSEGCYWERLSGLGGEEEEVIANESTDDPALVTVAPTDRAFDSSGCATWTSDLSPVTESLTAPFGNGAFVIGVDVAPGTWRSSGASDCYWERLSGFGGEDEDVIDNDSASEEIEVKILPTDRGLRSKGCHTWTKVG